MTTFLYLSAFGLLLGLVLARLAARGRRERLTAELKQAEADVERLGYIEAALSAYPFGEGIPQVSTALTAARIMRHSARRRAALCQEALRPRPRRQLSEWTRGALVWAAIEVLLVLAVGTLVGLTFIRWGA